MDAAAGNIWSQSYWGDEVFSVLISQKSLGEIFRLTVKDTSPPLYYFLLHYWIEIFGDGEIATRSLSLIFHLLTAGLCYRLVGNLSGSKKGALATATIVLLNPFLIQYAMESRGYSLLTLLILGATTLWIEGRYWWSGVWWVLTVWTHNYGVLFLSVFGGWWLINNRGKIWQKETWQLWGLPILGVGLWMPFLIGQWERVKEGFWLGRRNWTALGEMLFTFTGGGLDYRVRWETAGVGIGLITTSIIIWWSEKAGKGDGKEKMLGVTGIGVPVVAMAVSLLTPVFFERYLVGVVPLLSSWASIYLIRAAGRNKWPGGMVKIIVSVYLVLLATGAVELANKETKTDIRGAVKRLADVSQQGDLLLVEDEEVFLTAKYYANKINPKLIVKMYVSNGEPVFYVGAVLVGENEVLSFYPENKRVWIIDSRGEYYLKLNGERKSGTTIREGG
jgi:hypothetical protein